MKRILLVAFLAVSLSGPFFPIRDSFAETAEQSAPQKEQYTCPMHPQVKSDHPGECPICHMKLVRVKTKAPQAANPSPSPSPKTTPGDRKVKYYRHPMDPSIHSKVPAKDSMGMDYIPVYEEEKAQGPSDSKMEGRASFNLTPEQLKLSGTRIVPVERKTLLKELRVPGRALGSESISFQVYEQDLGLIKPGMAFQAEAPMFPGERLAGQITSIESILDPMTRTARVNGVLRQKPSQPLRAEASLSGVIEVRLSDVIIVPETAVLHTGTKDLVFIATEGGGFSPRAVALGGKAQGFYEIKKGVNAGEQISAGPNFLLDSESRIQFSYDSSDN